MAETDSGKFFKSPCPHCTGNIEYPAYNTGARIPCPHCGVIIALCTGKAKRVLNGSVPYRYQGGGKSFVASMGGYLMANAISYLGAWALNSYRCSACKQDVTRKDQFCPGCGAQFG